MGTDSKRGTSSIWMLTPVLLCGLTVSQAAAKAKDSCSAVRFQKGATSATVTGIAPGFSRNDPHPEIACFSIDVAKGQRANIRLLQGENVAITIPGVGDASTSFDFTTRQAKYKLNVFQLMPGGADERFRLNISVSPRK